MFMFVKRSLLCRGPFRTCSAKRNQNKQTKKAQELTSDPKNEITLCKTHYFVSRWHQTLMLAKRILTPRNTLDIRWLFSSLTFYFGDRPKLVLPLSAHQILMLAKLIVTPWNILDTRWLSASLSRRSKLVCVSVISALHSFFFKT